MMNRALQIILQRSKISPVVLKRTFNTTPANHSGKWLYRENGIKYLSKQHMMIAEAIGGLMWWWILVHCWYQPEHVLGDFPFPDPSKWTNAELGIKDN